MPDDPITPPSGETPAATAAGGEGNEPPKPNLTVEEVQAEWQHRMSQRDKAHAAEAGTLRTTNAALQAELEKLRSEQEQRRLAGMSEAERVAAERDALKAQLEQERLARVVDTRKIKYANIAAELGDEVIAAMDEAKLAALNERFAAPQDGAVPPSLIDSNSAARTAAPGGTPPTGKTRAELLADLEKFSPAFQASLGQGVKDQT